MDKGSRRAAGVQQWMCSQENLGSNSLAELSELKAGKQVTGVQVEKMGTLCLSGSPTLSSTSGFIG